MNQDFDTPKPSWVEDRKVINECLRRHPLARLLVVFCLEFTGVSFACFVFYHVGIVTSADAMFGMAVSMSVIFTLSFCHSSVRSLFRR